MRNEMMVLSSTFQPGVHKERRKSFVQQRWMELEAAHAKTELE